MKDRWPFYRVDIQRIVEIIDEHGSFLDNVGPRSTKKMVPAENIEKILKLLETSEEDVERIMSILEVET